jgi:hypothetical protein
MNFMNPSILLAAAIDRRIISLLVAGLFASPVFAQAAKVERDLVPTVNVTDLGTGRPILLQWRDSSDAASTLQVTTRTVPTLLENGLDLKEDAETVFATTPRPPLERFWTIQGRIRVTEDSSMPLAQWRILDAAARLFMLRPTGIPEAKVEDPDGDPPKKSATGKAEQKTGRTTGTGSGIPSASAPNASAIERARAFARVQDNAISRTAGAAISQRFSGYGIIPTSTQIRLEIASLRNMYEVERLVSILRLAEPLIPNRPVGIGATWTSRWTNLEQRTPVETIMTWTLASVDEAALEATGIAETAVLTLRYTRRIAEGLDEPVAPRIAKMLESNGSGEVRLVLQNPMHLDAQLVQMPPPSDPARRNATDVTRMRVVTRE